MTTPTILDAMRLLDDRKESLGVPAHGREVELTGERPSDRPDARALLVGLDLDADELSHAATAVGQHGATGILLLGVIGTVGGAWIDGLLTGLLLADLRKPLAATFDEPIIDPRVAVDKTVRRALQDRAATDMRAGAGRCTLNEVAQAVADGIVEELVRQSARTP